MLDILSHVIQETKKSELDAVKSAHASALASQAADCQMHKIQLDNDRTNIDQLKTALDQYQQREVRFTEIIAADCLLYSGTK